MGKGAVGTGKWENLSNSEKEEGGERTWVGLSWGLRSKVLHKGGEGRCSLGDSRQGTAGRCQHGWAICQPVITSADPPIWVIRERRCLLGVCLSLSLRSCRKLPPECPRSRYPRKTLSVSQHKHDRPLRLKLSPEPRRWAVRDRNFLPKKKEGPFPVQSTNSMPLTSLPHLQGHFSGLALSISHLPSSLSWLHSPW